MPEETVAKCTRESYCTALDERLDEIAGRKGLVAVNGMHRVTGKVRHLGVAYKRSAKDKGVFLNCCPFCAERIDWFAQPEPGEVPAPAVSTAEGLEC